MANRVVEILVSVKDEAIGFFGRLGEAISGVKDHVFSLSGVLEAFLTGKVLEGVKNLVEQFAEFDMTLTRMNASLQVSGRYTKEGSEEIQRMASTMQDLTVVSREAALQISATVGALARELTPTQLAEIQKAAIGLSETFGISLERATSLIGRTMEGNFNALHRYGIEIDMAGNQQERFTQLMAKTAPLFKISEEAANTLAGQIEQAKNQFVELERTAGELIAKFFGLEKGSKSLKEEMKVLNAELRENSGKILSTIDDWIDRVKLLGELVRTVFELVRGVVSAIADAFLGINSIGAGLMAAIKAAIHGDENPFNHLKVAFAAVVDGLKDDFKPFLDSLDAVDARIDKIRAREVAPPPKNPLAPIGAQEKSGLKNVGVQEEDIPQEILHETEVTKELVAQQKLLADARAAGTITDRDYGLAQAQLAFNMDQEIIGVRQLLDVQNLSLTQRTNLETLLVRLLAAQKALNNEGLVEATKATRELTEAEKLNREEYNLGLISIEEYTRRREKEEEQIKAEIVIVKAMIATTSEATAEYAKLLKILDDLEKALAKVGGAFKKLGEGIKDALLGDPKRAVEEVTADIIKSAEVWEDAWSKSAGAAIAHGANVMGSIGKAIQEEAKKEEALMLADAIKYTARGIGELFFNPAAAGKDFEAAALSTAAAAAYALIAGGGGGGGGASGGGGAGGGAASAQQTTSAVSNLASGVNIYIPTGFPNSQAFLDELISNLEQGGVRGVHVVSQG